MENWVVGYSYFCLTMKWANVLPPIFSTFHSEDVKAVSQFGTEIARPTVYCKDSLEKQVLSTSSPFCLLAKVTRESHSVWNNDLFFTNLSFIIINTTVTRAILPYWNFWSFPSGSLFLWLLLIADLTVGQGVSRAGFVCDSLWAEKIASLNSSYICQ